jgi:hypothetical protein
LLAVGEEVVDGEKQREIEFAEFFLDVTGAIGMMLNAGLAVGGNPDAFMFVH